MKLGEWIAQFGHKYDQYLDELGEMASQSGITDITDAFDTLVIGVRFHNASRLRFVGMPIGG